MKSRIDTKKHEELLADKKSAVLTLENIYKDFQVKLQKIKVLRGVDLTVNKGDFVVILGPSGSGKSTMLNVILGLEKPDRGKVNFLGMDLVSMTEDEIAEFRKKNIGMVYQQSNWIGSLNVLENVAFPLMLQRMKKGKALRTASDLLQLFNLGEWANFSPRELSSGQQQKISLARCLVTDPDVIIADEPTGNLDYRSGKQLVELLASLSKEGKTIIMVTHDLEYIEMASRIVRFLDGKIVEEIRKTSDTDMEALKAKLVTQKVADEVYKPSEDFKPEQTVKKNFLRNFFSKIKNMRFRPRRGFRRFLNGLVEAVELLRSFVLVIYSVSVRLILNIMDFELIRRSLIKFRYSLHTLFSRGANLLSGSRDVDFNYLDIIDLSLRNMLSKRARALITIGGIAVGIGFTTFLVSLGFGLERLVIQSTAQLNQLRSLDVFATISQNLEITETELTDFQNIDNVEQVMPVIAVAGNVSYQDSATDIVAYGVQSVFLEVSDFTLTSGEYFTNNLLGSVPDLSAISETGEDVNNLVETETGTKRLVNISTESAREAIVNQAFLDIYNLDGETALGEQFELVLVATEEVVDQDVELESNPATYVITGVINNNDSPVIYLPLEQVRSIGISTFSQVRLVSYDQDMIPSIRQTIDVLGYRTSTILDTVNQIEDTFATIRLFLVGVGFVALAVASFGMFNTLTVSLLERTREVGLMKALGMKSQEVKDLFLSESILMGLSGGIMGIVLGFIGGGFLSVIFSILAVVRGYDSIQVTYLPLTTGVIILVVAAVTGIVTGWYPARRATRISALNALRYE